MRPPPTWRDRSRWSQASRLISSPAGSPSSTSALQLLRPATDSPDVSVMNILFLFRPRVVCASHCGGTRWLLLARAVTCRWGDASHPPAPVIRGARMAVRFISGQQCIVVAGPRPRESRFSSSSFLASARQECGYVVCPCVSRTGVRHPAHTRLTAPPSSHSTDPGGFPAHAERMGILRHH